jgi:hypothetical protein
LPVDAQSPGTELLPPLQNLLGNARSVYS